MIKEKLIRKIFVSQLYELTAVEQFLEEMALKGLMFVKATGMIYYFRECEPKKVKFAVDIFDKASVFDTREANSTLEYIDYCKEAGWKFLYSTGKIQFFCTELEDMVEIQTDDKIKLKSIMKMQLLQYLPSWISTFLISYMFLREFFNINTYFSFYVITSSFMVNINLGMLLMLLLVIIAIMRFFSFLLRNLLRIRKGQKMKYNTIKSVRIFNGIYMFICLFTLGSILLNSASSGIEILGIYLVILLFFVILLMIEYKRMQNKKLSRTSNRVIVIAMAVIAPIIMSVLLGGFVVGALLSSDGTTIPYKTSEGMITLSYSSDKVPMTLEDLGLESEEYDYIDSYADENSSIFAASREYSYGECFADESKSIEDISISYSIFSTQYTWLMDKYLAFYLDEKRKEVVEVTDDYAKAWNAKVVYAAINRPEPGESIEDFDTSYYIVYNDKVIELYGDYKYTVEEVAKIKEILDLD